MTMPRSTFDLEQALRGLRNKGHKRHALIGGSHRAAWKRRNTVTLRRYR